MEEMNFKKIIYKYRNMLIARFDNHKFKKKFYFIYIFCVLLPVIVTNSLVLGLVINSEKTQREKSAENIAKAVAYSMNSLIENAVSVTKDIYTNKWFNRFLEKEYRDPLDYFTAFQGLNQNNILRLGLGESISKITLYADNQTLLNGGNFAGIDSIENEEWYQYFKNTKKDMILYSYYDNSHIYIPNTDSGRSVSVIRKLNFYGKNGCEKLIKLDLNYNGTVRDIISSNYEDEVYICKGNEIIFSNTEKTIGKNNFDIMSEEKLNSATAKKTMSLYSQEWDIYVIGTKSNVFETLLGNFWLLLLLVLANVLLPVVIIYCVNRSITDRIIVMGHYLDRVKEEKFDEIEGIENKDEIGILIKNYNLMARKIKQLIQVVYKDKLERQQLTLARKEAELLALHSQINPHFTFNALESIRMRSVLKQEKETADIIGKLAILMRKSTDWGKDTITIKEEMEFVDAYLQLQKYRFGEKLSYCLKVQKICEGIEIPKLTIVTFVENACVHGIEGISHAGVILVTVAAEEGILSIEIEDTGKGMNEKQVKSLMNLIESANIDLLENTDSVGILNACIRLKMYCENHITFEIESEEEVGTMITIEMESYQLGRKKNVEGIISGG